MFPFFLLVVLATPGLHFLAARLRASQTGAVLVAEVRAILKINRQPYRVG